MILALLRNYRKSAILDLVVGSAKVYSLPETAFGIPIGHALPVIHMRNRNLPLDIKLFIQSINLFYQKHCFWMYGQTPWNRIESSSDGGNGSRCRTLVFRPLRPRSTPAPVPQLCTPWRWSRLRKAASSR